MGFLAILDMFLLPDFEEDLPADLLLFGLDIGEDTLGGREDDTAKTTLIGTNIRGLLIHASRRLGNTLDAMNPRFAIHVHEPENELPLVLVLLHRRKEAGLFQNLGDISNVIGVDNDDAVLASVTAVFDPYDEI